MASAVTASATRSLRRGSSRERLTDDEVLRRAARLVASGWCQKGLAADQYGRQVEPWSEDACSWSPLGALARVWFERGGAGLHAFEAAYTSLALASGGRLEEWNAAPWRTKWHVLRAFARAHEFLPEARERMHARNDGPPEV
jgi:hypothetical protein